MNAPLSGVRVLDAAAMTAGPACAAHLAMLGADVVRIPPPTDWTVELDTGPGSIARCVEDATARGKTVQDRPAEDAEYVQRVQALIPSLDVLVVDWTPARQAALGIDLVRLREQCPALVIVAVTPYGLTGPDTERPATELTAYHAGGEGYLLPGGKVHRQVPDRAPVRAGRLMADEDAGLAAAYATVTALIRRAVSDAGDLVDVSILEVQLGEGRTTLGRAFYENADFDRTYAGYDYAGVLRCTDGWICVRPSEQRHWQSFCEVIGRADLTVDLRFVTRNDRFLHGDELNAELESWTNGVPRSTVRAALLQAGCPGGPYLEPAEVLTDAAITSRGIFGPAPGGGTVPTKLFTVAATGTEGGGDALRGRLGTAAPGPLAGLRVLDLTWVAAGPYTTELLAFAGADVIKVESRTQPDLFRRALEPGGDLDENIRFVDLNQGKRSLCLDLKSDAGRTAALALAATCDLVVENYRPGVRDRLGLGDAALWAANPDLVIVALSGFGADTVDADRPGYASIFSAESGLSAMTGWPDCEPADVRDTNDLRSGTLGALAAVSGLLAVARGAAATSLDVSARDALVILQAHALLQGSRGVPVSRTGNAFDGDGPYGVFRAMDGWVAVSVVTGAQRDALSGVLAGIELESWLASRPGAEAARELCAAGVPAALSAPAGALRRDPHLRARNALRSIEHPRLGPLTVVGPPVRFASLPVGPDAARPPLLGEHDVAVLAEAGLAADRIDQVILAAGGTVMRGGA